MPFSVDETIHRANQMLVASERVLEAAEADLIDIDHAITSSRAELSSSADVLGTPTVVSRRHRRHLPVLDAPRIQVDPQ